MSTVTNSTLAELETAHGGLCDLLALTDELVTVRCLIAMVERVEKLQRSVGIKPDAGLRGVANWPGRLSRVQNIVNHAQTQILAHKVVFGRDPRRMGWLNGRKNKLARAKALAKQLPVSTTDPRPELRRLRQTQAMNKAQLIAVAAWSRWRRCVCSCS